MGMRQLMGSSRCGISYEWGAANRARQLHWLILYAPIMILSSHAVPEVELRSTHKYSSVLVQADHCCGTAPVMLLLLMTLQQGAAGIPASAQPA
jgi:hypothetical protein